MFLARATFGKSPEGVESEDIDDKLDGYFATLQKNGQICGDALHAKSNGEVVAFANLTRPDSWAHEHHSRYGIRDLEAICNVFGCNPSWEILVDDIPTGFPDIGNASALCLFTSAFNGRSPVCQIGTGDRFPAYMLPIDDDERERLFFWSREYNRMDGIWFASGELEIPAYEQMASPSSLLSQQGREIAACIESAIEIPVYYFLMRYYGRGERELDRKCPGCGNAWQNHDNTVQADSFWNFAFRCDPCRLVSQVADANYDDSHASIGEFPISQ